MKYIDADKLKAEIERRLAAYQKNFDKADNKIARLSTDGRIASLKALLPFIDSLQQEQPKPSGYEKGLLEVKEMVDKLYDETSIGLSEYDSGLYNGIAETCMKLRGFIKARLDSDDQPEVDLEKEYETWWNSIAGKINIEHIMEWYMHETARHFYKLGLNAKNQ